MSYLVRTARRRLAAGLLILTLGSIPTAQSPPGAWSQWRGPSRDGAIVGFEPPAAWPEMMSLDWRVSVGGGYAAPVVAGDRVYLHTREGDRETTTAYDAASGTRVWQEQYPAPYDLHPAARQHGFGPKSTPVIADGRLFTFGIGGVLSAHDAATGQLLWRREGPAAGPYYGTATSPLVDGDRLVAHVGGHDDGALTAFDVASGDVRWRWSGDGPSYGSPVVATLAGVRQVITYTQAHLVGVELETGGLLWQLPFETRSVQNTVTPLVVDDTVISAGLDQPVQAIRLSRVGGDWTSEMVWENRNVSFYMSSPVRVGDAIFGLSERNSGQYVSVDVATGATRWMSAGRQAAYATFLHSSELLFVLNNAAELFVLDATRDQFDPLRQYDVADGQTWAHPAVVGDAVYVKDDGTLARWLFR